jgi:alkanesulfonate monooxygenase SsuD/methylene tetrahydromethanopterin reductase-like flavin-dependent oxidoreductase (luciferase family)
VWFGASSDRAYERAGRLGDGWFPMMEPGPRLDHARKQVDRAALALSVWAAAGATHVSVNTMGAGLGNVDEHLGALERVAANLP